MIETRPLVELAVGRGEGVLAKDGPLVVATGKHTGRSAKDKFIVRDADTENNVWWDNNRSMDPAHFAALKADFLAALGARDTLFVQDLFGGSQPEHRVQVRVSTDEERPVPSVTGIWPVAGWLEREVYDLYGVLFAGNDDLRRIRHPLTGGVILFVAVFTLTLINWFLSRGKDD